MINVFEITFNVNPGIIVFTFDEHLWFDTTQLQEPNFKNDALSLTVQVSSILKMSKKFWSILHTPRIRIHLIYYKRMKKG